MKSEKYTKREREREMAKCGTNIKLYFLLYYRVEKIKSLCLIILLFYLIKNQNYGHRCSVVVVVYLEKIPQAKMISNKIIKNRKKVKR